MSRAVLALNAGSSTLKYALFEVDKNGERELASATLELAGGPGPGAMAELLDRLRAAGHPKPSVVGHRLVHGGERYVQPTLVDDDVLTELSELMPLAPLHLPAALALLRAAREACADARHVACFDTAFHATIPELGRRFALPDELYRGGLRRYGFHGLSCEYVLSVLGAPPPARLIIAHLGGGASLTAVAHGKSIDTSMGFTPAGGIPMGTRPGDLDPGVLLHLLETGAYDTAALARLINHESGLLGLGGSSDMAELLRRHRAFDPRARSAIEVFAYAIKKQIGAYAAALGGLDCLVFSGGIGEHAALVRSLACAGLEHLGIELDPAQNAANAERIARSGAACEVRIVATHEERMIARHAFAVAAAATTG